MSRKETQFKSWLIKSWEASGGWAERYEPRRGSGVGIADIQLLVDRLVPIELKIAEVRNGVLYSDDIRGSQIGWHTRLNKFGCSSYFIWGVGIVSEDKPPKEMYIGRVSDTLHWRDGILVDKLWRLDGRRVGVMFRIKLYLECGV